METREVYRLGRYVVDLERRRVSSNGTTVELAWRHFEALRLLVEANGRVVEKEEFFGQIWQGQLVDESNLTKCIAQLRKALNNGGDEDYLETVPRIGYRLAVQAMAAPLDDTAAKVRTKPRARWLIAAGAATFLVAAGLASSVAARNNRLSEAEAAYQEGRRIRNQKNKDTVGQAIAAFQRAIDLNPNNAAYHASMAEALGQVPASPALDNRLMLEAARRSVALEPRSGGCNAVLGFILYSRFWEWKTAESHLKVALEVNPKDAGGRGYYAMLLASQGRLDEALNEVDTGIGLSPYHATLHSIRSSVLYFAGRYPEVSDAASRGASFGVRQPLAWDWRAYSHFLSGDKEGAVSVVAMSGLEFYPRELAGMFRVEGFDAAARRVLTTTEAMLPNAAWRRAHWRMMMGDRTGALEELEVAHKAKLFDLMYIAVDPMFEPLHKEPRFRKIVEDMKLSLR